MRLKLDENLPRRIEDLLSGKGHDVTTALGQGLGGRDDALVARVAAAEDRMIVTQDRRFADVRRYPPGQHPGFIVLRSSDLSAASVAILMERLLDRYNLDELTGSIVVVDQSSIRIRYPE